MSPLNNVDTDRMFKTAVISPATDASGSSYPALLFLYLFHLSPSKVPYNLLMYALHHLLSVFPCKHTYSQEVICLLMYSRSLRHFLEHE